MLSSVKDRTQTFILDPTKTGGLASIREHITAIREQKDTTTRIKMLRDLNDSLPPEKRIEFPSLITNAYIRTALDKIEARTRGSASTS